VGNEACKRQFVRANPAHCRLARESKTFDTAKFYKSFLTVS